MQLVTLGDDKSFSKEFPSIVNEICDSLTAVNVMQSFNIFFDSRDKAKLSLYHSVVGYGIIIFVLGMLMLVSWIAPFVYNNPYSPLYDTLFIMGNFLRVLGVVFYSTVPCDEFDLFAFLLKPQNYIWKVLFLGVMGLGVGCTGIFY